MEGVDYSQLHVAKSLLKFDLQNTIFLEKGFCKDLSREDALKFRSLPIKEAPENA